MLELGLLNVRSGNPNLQVLSSNSEILLCNIMATYSIKNAFQQLYRFSIFAMISMQRSRFSSPPLEDRSIE